MYKPEGGIKLLVECKSPEIKINQKINNNSKIKKLELKFSFFKQKMKFKKSKVKSLL